MGRDQAIYGCRVCEEMKMTCNAVKALKYNKKILHSALYNNMYNRQLYILI